MNKLIFILFILLFSSNLHSQNTEKRVALVIGNTNYKYCNILTHPLQDAIIMKTVLQELNFEVIYVTDADQVQMKNAFILFIRRIKDANISLFYYSGHGMQMDGVNYLIPIDADITDKISATENTININDWISKLEVNEKRLNIVILDACRNNQFKSFTKGNEIGLKPMPVPSGTIIAFATAPDNVAQDNGLYAQTLASEMRKNQRIDDVFRKTRKAIKNKTNGNQQPMEWMMNDEVVYLRPEAKNIQNNITISNDIAWVDNKFGYFTDTRDNHQYKVVKIGEQTWFAENLAFNTGSGNSIYNNDRSNLTKYGYLYEWEAGEKACPSGWHLPRKDEWEILFDYLGGKDIAGGKLKAKQGWNSPNVGANNESGFSALPGGWSPKNSLFDGMGAFGRWWSSTCDGFNGGKTYIRIDLYNHGVWAAFDNYWKDGSLYIRCIKD